MTQKASDRDAEESVRHAQWVREHARIEETGFPEYPDEPARRGSSRGAVPNGNPWRPVDPDERPGRAAPEGKLDGERVSAPPDSDCLPTQRVPRTPPPTAHDATPAIIAANSEDDERIGREVADVLANAKSLEGTHLLVEIVDGDVQLSGTVADQAVKNEVERLTSTVREVKHIVNQLDVRQ